MENEILLISENFVKGVTNISDNITPKYLRPAMQEGQEIQYRSIVGDSLLKKLKEVAARKEEKRPEDADYIALIEESRYYLAYISVVELIPRVSFKIANLGLLTTGDDNANQASMSDIDKVVYYYQSKADSFAYQLQNYLLRNKANFPELCDNQCNAIKSNLYSAGTCGIFLGGKRGKDVKRRLR